MKYFGISDIAYNQPKSSPTPRKIPLREMGASACFHQKPYLPRNPAAKPCSKVKKKHPTSPFVKTNKSTTPQPRAITIILRPPERRFGGHFSAFTHSEENNGLQLTTGHTLEKPSKAWPNRFIKIVMLPVCSQTCRAAFET